MYYQDKFIDIRNNVHNITWESKKKKEQKSAYKLSQVSRDKERRKEQLYIPLFIHLHDLIYYILFICKAI